MLEPYTSECDADAGGSPWETQGANRTQEEPGVTIPLLGDQADGKVCMVRPRSVRLFSAAVAALLVVRLASFELTGESAQSLAWPERRFGCVRVRVR